MPRHPDFDRIYSQFQARYCTGDSEDTSPKGGPCKKGDQVYYGWLSKMGLDDTKPYGEQLTEALCRRFDEGFQWTHSRISLLRENELTKYYKVEALFPLTSMNDNIYTEDELIRGARTLIGVVPNINHTGTPIEGTRIEDAEYEAGAVEAVMSVDKAALCPMCVNQYKVIDMLDQSPDIPSDFHIIHVSIEASCRMNVQTPAGNQCDGLRFTGIALLTKPVLPGVPLTRIMPMESFDTPEPHGETSLTSLEDTKQEDPEKTVKSDTQAEYNKAPEDTPWDFDASKYDIDQLRHACAVVTGPSGTDGSYTKQDCHLPHHLPGDGKTHGGILVWRGVAAAGVVLSGGRGGVNIPAEIREMSEEAKARARSHLEKHYREFDKQPPWEDVTSKQEKPASEAQKEQVVSKPQKPDLIRRIQELKAHGVSARDAWRLACFELLDWIQKNA